MRSAFRNQLLVDSCHLVSTLVRLHYPELNRSRPDFPHPPIVQQTLTVARSNQFSTCFKARSFTLKHNNC